MPRSNTIQCVSFSESGDLNMPTIQGMRDWGVTRCSPLLTKLQSQFLKSSGRYDASSKGSGHCFDRGLAKTPVRTVWSLLKNTCTSTDVQSDAETHRCTSFRCHEQEPNDAPVSPMFWDTRCRPQAHLHSESGFSSCSCFTDLCARAVGDADRAR